MRKLWPFITILFTSTVFITACKKNMEEEQFTPIVNPVIPDFTTQVTASVNGFITDENGNAVDNASIKGGNITVTTDKYGYFKISNAAFAKSAGFVQVSKSGYFTGYSTFLPVAGKESFIRLQLIPKIVAGNVDAASGGTVSTSGGATVTLPANGVMVAGNNSTYTGAVSIAVHWLNPAEEDKTQLTMPGNLTGVDSAGHLNVLVTYGMLAVELTGTNGELLQIATGKKASLRFPIPASLSGTAPASIPLWYFDETKGVWIQEGRAINNSNVYEGTVSHFSYWNCDAPFPLVNFMVQVVDTALNPLSNIPVQVNIVNMPYLARVAYTDTNGLVTGMVPSNNQLKITVGAPCNQNINVSNITTTNASLDLGTVVVNTNQYGATLQGTVTKCNGSTVTDGYVVVAGFGSNSIINITNGSFSTTGIVCPGTNAFMIAFDRETSLQSTQHDITLTSGINNSGVLQVCNTAVTELITIEGGGNATYSLPQYLFGGNFYFMNDSTSINAIDLLNGNQQAIQFSFTGAAAPGTYALAGNSFMWGNLPVVFTNATSVNVATYGLIGQFITGSFSGPASIAGGAAQNIYINFNVKRDQ
jgi:hypothetical protein